MERIIVRTFRIVPGYVLRAIVPVLSFTPDPWNATLLPFGHALSDANNVNCASEERYGEICPRAKFPKMSGPNHIVVSSIPF